MYIPYSIYYSVYICIIIWIFILFSKHVNALTHWMLLWWINWRLLKVCVFLFGGEEGKEREIEIAIPQTKFWVFGLCVCVCAAQITWLVYTIGSVTSGIVNGIRGKGWFYHYWYFLSSILFFPNELLFVCFLFVFFFCPVLSSHANMRWFIENKYFHKCCNFAYIFSLVLAIFPKFLKNEIVPSRTSNFSKIREPRKMAHDLI